MRELHTSYAFEEFVEKSAKAKDFNELFEMLSSAVKRHGFDRIIFSVAQDNDLPNDYNKIGLAQNYPSDWQNYYQDREYHRIDPVLKYAAITDEPFRWDDLNKKFHLSKKQTKFMQEGQEARLFNGIGVPIKLGAGQFAGVALATSESKDACHINLDLLNAYCHQFYLSFKRMHKTVDGPKELITISKKEEEVLLWAARGKTDEDISVIMGISKNTVDTHMRHIFQKLDAPNRVVAVVSALTRGLIKL